MDKKLIIKALKYGVPMRRIAKELKINERTFWRMLDRDKEMQQAKQYHLTLIDNLFS